MASINHVQHDMYLRPTATGSHSLTHGSHHHPLCPHHHDHGHHSHTPHHHHHHHHQRDKGELDMSNEFTCFLCNGYQTVIGSITVDPVGIKLTTAIGGVLEMDPYDELVSVNEMEPENNHTLVIVFPQRYVMLSHLLRKEKLVEVFKTIGLYKEEPHLPPEAIGFYNPKILNERQSGLRPVYPIKDDDFEEEMEPVERSDKKPEDNWTNQEEQDRHIQREIRQQAVLNPVQMLSSEDYVRKKTISGDWMQLDKYPSSTMQTKDSETQQNVKRPAKIKQQNSQPQMSSSQPQTYHSSTQSVPNTSHDVESHDKKTPEVLQYLKMLFPNHNNDTLLSVLIECRYDMDDTITALLNKDEFANAL